MGLYKRCVFLFVCSIYSECVDAYTVCVYVCRVSICVIHLCSCICQVCMCICLLCSCINYCCICKVYIYNWASSWDYCTYHIGYLWRLRWACTSVQFCQSLCYLHTWGMEVDEWSNQKTDIKPLWMTAHARLKNEFTGDKKYHLRNKFHFSEMGHVQSKWRSKDVTLTWHETYCIYTSMNLRKMEFIAYIYTLFLHRFCSLTVFVKFWLN